MRHLEPQLLKKVLELFRKGFLGVLGQDGWNALFLLLVYWRKFLGSIVVLFPLHRFASEVHRKRAKFVL